MTTLPERLQEILVVMREAQKEYAGHHSSGTFRRLADRLEAAQSLQAQEGRGWRPIDSAPMDESVVLVLRPDSDIPQSARYYENCGWQVAWDGHALVGINHPTHWQPLPAAPSPAALQAGEA